MRRYVVEIVFLEKICSVLCGEELEKISHDIHWHPPPCPLSIALHTYYHLYCNVLYSGRKRVAKAHLGRATAIPNGLKPL